MAQGSLNKNVKGSNTSNVLEKPKFDLIKDLKNRLKNIDKDKQLLANTIKNLEKLKYKPGDFVVHKKYGNCVITSYHIKHNCVSYGTTQPDFGSDKANSIEFGYNIFSSNWEIYHPVAEEELIIYNNTTKLLYDK